MARPKKESKMEVGKVEFEIPVEVGEILLRLADLENRVANLEAQKEEKVVKPAPAKSIQKVEDFNGEVASPKGSYAEGWAYEDQIYCMKNTVKILPPNLIAEGRHSLENVQAICPFKVTEEMMDDLYAEFTHEV